MTSRTLPTPRARSSRIVWLRRIYGALAAIIAVSIMVQVFLAGMNVFLSPRWLGAHMQLGHLIGGLIIGLPLLAFVAGLPPRVRWLSLAMVLLFGLQYNHRNLALLFGLPHLAAIHAVNALVLFWLAVYLALQIRLEIQQNTDSTTSDD